MSKRRLVLCLVAACTVGLFAVPYAQAQASRTWVSGTGDDVNPCSRTAPCKTFAGAISKTATGGIINALDNAGYGTVTITKSITIDGSSQLAGVLASGGFNGININPPASGPPITVRLKDLDIEGGLPGGTSFGGVGINIGSGGVGVRSVTVENTTIFGFTATPSTSAAIRWTGAGKLFVRNSNIDSNTRGIRIQSNSASPLAASVSNTNFDDNDVGLAAIGGAATLTVKNDEVSGSQSIGLDAEGGGRVLAQGSSFDGGGTGIRADGAGSQVRVSDSSIVFNAAGVVFSNGGQVLSRGNNTLEDNAAGNAFSGPYAAH
jgi:Right handed beta helix region